ncbi:hypothetical protein KA047_00125 [Candidatus Saccharibacteria bacterium]|nr:hypothetical protein [Candidatus Saccharibacteria bacterium]
MSAYQPGLIIDGLLDTYEIDGWQPIVEAFDMYTERRSVSGALISLCLFHDEKTPSFWMYPSERAICYGCSAHGTRGDVIAQQTTVQPSIVLSRLNISIPGIIATELDAGLMEHDMNRNESIRMYAELAENEEVF